jgi:hypothetical protein
MNNNNLKLSYRIGTFRHGTSILIPDSLNSHTVSSYLEQFNVDERVDILCVTEFLMLKNSRLDIINQEAQAALNINEHLRANLREPLFAKTLLDLGLVTSIDFLRFGKKLCWPTPSEEFI